MLGVVRGATVIDGHALELNLQHAHMPLSQQSPILNSAPRRRLNTCQQVHCQQVRCQQVRCQQVRCQQVHCQQVLCQQVPRQQVPRQQVHCQQVQFPDCVPALNKAANDMPWGPSISSTGSCACGWLWAKGTEGMPSTCRTDMCKRTQPSTVTRSEYV